MTLSTGTKLAHYEISSQLGKGGMGEVYRAKDQKLGRDVAIKVLPEEFAKDADRVARFQREAKLLASLNHPNIAAIYGLEESDGTHFLVLELIEGDTLADRIKGGPIPVEESLKLALQIAEALEAAHAKGVIHRDLKPANIKVTPDGKVKVLDFGLAKAFAGESVDMNLSNSPTLSVAATQQGVILGTAAYMSPEQARGETVDRRADIWAFGCVLYEMLTGCTTFEGRSVSDILASVLKSEPEWKNLSANLHSRIRLLLERCLEKEARNRLSGISDARVDIQKVLADPGGVIELPTGVTPPPGKSRSILYWIAAAVILTAVIVGTVVWDLRAPPLRQVTRFYYELPKGHEFSIDTIPMLAVSPDGSRFAYSTSGGVYLRSMSEIDAKLIAGTVGKTTQPFFSPDGEWIGYWAVDESQLKKISVAGGIPQPLCKDPSPAYYHWAKDGNIYYAGTRGITRVSENGGTPEILIDLCNDEAFFSPRLLPDGKTIIFTLDTDTGYKIATQSLDTNDRNILFDGHTPLYLPTGHLAYLVGNDLNAVPFDVDRLKPTGDSVTIVEDILVNGPPHFCISSSGTFAYLKNISMPRSLMWVDFNGKEENLNTPPDLYASPKISHDGTRVALGISDSTGNQEIGIWNIARRGMIRLPNKGTINYMPNWAPDSQSIVFGLMRGSNIGIYRMSSDGTGAIESLYTETGRQILPSSLSRNGNILLCQIQQTGIDIPDIGMLSMEGNPKWQLLLQESCTESQPQLSPDEKWMAYVSNESGRAEIYVRSFPETDKVREQISTNGGNNPLWSRDGRELYYRNGSNVMAVAIEPDPRFRAEKPRSLFPDSYVSSDVTSTGWDIHPNGKKFLMMKEVAIESQESSRPKIYIVQNWFEELKERVPLD